MGRSELNVLDVDYPVRFGCPRSATSEAEANVLFGNTQWCLAVRAQL